MMMNSVREDYHYYYDYESFAILKVLMQEHFIMVYKLSSNIKFF